MTNVNNLHELPQQHYVFALTTTDGETEEYYYQGIEQAKQHFAIMCDHEDADMYTTASLTLYNWNTKEETIIDTFEF